MSSISSVLVVAPHPDDEVLMAGGLLRRVAAAGGVASVLIVNLEDEGRRAEALAAAGVLGVSDVSFGGVWRGGLDTAPVRALAGLVEGALARLRPEVLVVPGRGAHQDHRMVHEACVVACRPSGGTSFFRPPWVLVAEEVADVWPPGWASPPAVSVVLSPDDVVAKMWAMEAHASQVRLAPSERSVAGIEALARVRGLQAGCDYAEAYSVMRCVL